MGIYIKGMEMPKAGNWKTIRIYYDGTCAEPNLQGDCRYMQGCEAIPVPPHGDLIERDALGIRDEEKQAYEALQMEKGEFFTEETLIEYLQGRCDGLVHASGLVRFAPTIIPADKEDNNG